MHAQLIQTESSFLLFETPSEFIVQLDLKTWFTRDAGKWQNVGGFSREITWNLALLAFFTRRCSVHKRHRRTTL